VLDMKQQWMKTSSYVVTMIVAIVVLVISDEAIYTSFVGILLMFLWLISLGLIMHSTVVFEGIDIKMGEKHKEKPLVLFLLINALVLVLFLIKALPYLGIDGWVSMWSLAALMVFLVVVVIVSYFYNYVSLGEDSLTYRYSGFSKTKTIHYKDIERISFGGLMNTFKLYTKHSLILVDITLKNADRILNEIYTHTTKEIHEQAFLKLARYYKLFGARSNVELLDFYKK